METWSTHHLFQEISGRLGNTTAASAQRYANQLHTQGLPVIFSLMHLSKITGLDYVFLHESVNRKRDSENYRIFAIGKRSGGRRFIHAASRKMLLLLKFINGDILQKIAPLPASFAFHSSGGIRECAAIHCGCKWLFKFDLRNFFYTISESDVYSVFAKIGYKPLLSFELARLCTTTFLPKKMRYYVRYNNSFSPLYKLTDQDDKNYPYDLQPELGVLPQGGPASPMLSNLVARKLDEALFDYAQNNGLVYSRYADDIALSASTLPKGKSIAQIRREIIFLIRKNGFCDNAKKFHVAGPGARKLILGLLVDGETPRLSKPLRKRIDRHIYSIEKFGLGAAAAHDGFESAYGYFNHVSGIMSFVHDVDKDLWDNLDKKFSAIKESLKI